MTEPASEGRRRMPNSELWAHLELELKARRYSDCFPWTADLPDPTKCPGLRTITVTREQLLRFRADYAELTAFVCAVTGRTFQELCRADLAFYCAEAGIGEWNRERAAREAETHDDADPEEIMP